jgi:hypothetical protein
MNVLIVDDLILHVGKPASRSSRKTSRRAFPLRCAMQLKEKPEHERFLQITFSWDLIREIGWHCNSEKAKSLKGVWSQEGTRLQLAPTRDLSRIFLFQAAADESGYWLSFASSNTARVNFPWTPAFALFDLVLGSQHHARTLSKNELSVDTAVQQTQYQFFRKALSFSAAR